MTKVVDQYNIKSVKNFLFQSCIIISNLTLQKLEHQNRQENKNKSSTTNHIKVYQKCRQFF